MNNRKFHEFLYGIENVVDEFVIAFLSFGTIVVLIWSIFFSAENVSMMSLGNLIQPWVTMLALMIIARELWLMNRHNQMRREGE